MRKQNESRRSFKEAFSSFMYGRNGADDLFRANMILAIVLAVINLFVGSSIILVIECIIAVYAIYRLLSKNLTKRQKENEVYCNLIKKIKNFFALQKHKWKDRKTHVYHKCPYCKNVLRLPKIKGDHTVNCPCCHNRFDMKV